MGVLDGKLGDVEAGNARPADLNGLSAEEAAEFRRMENGGLDDGDNGGPGDADGDQDGDFGAEPERDARRDNAPPEEPDGDDVDPLDKPLRLPGDRRETLEADGEDDGADGEADADADLPKLTDTQQTVSAGRFRRETKKLHDKLKAAQAELAKKGGDSAELQAERLRSARLEERLTMIVDALNNKQKQQQEQQKEDDDPEPDIDEQPFEHQKWMRRRYAKLEEANRQLREGVHKTEQARTADQESQILERQYIADCQNYAATDETFALAYNHLKLSRYVEIAEQRFGKDITVDDPANKLTAEEQATVEGQFRREEQAIATQALKRDQRPALAVMRLAKARGFSVENAKKAIADYKAKQNGGKVPNGKADQQPERRSVTDEVKNLQQRRAASKSLSDGGSAPANGRLTLRQVVDMPQGEFGRLLDKLGRDGYDEALLGKESA